ncbi:MAG: AMP-binding protein [Myxococcota bacterium]
MRGAAPPSLARLIGRAAGWYGDRVAVVDGPRSLRFGEVEARSNRLANALIALAPTPGTRVALLMNNRLEFVEADFAIVKSGKVKLPINPRLVDRERAWLLQNSGAEILIAEASFAPFVEAAWPSLPALETVIALDGSIAGGLDYAALLEKGAPDPPGIEPDEEAASFILYTSGTTGRPKGAVSSQRGRRAATLTMLAEEIDAGPGDAMVHVGSVAHGSGSKILAYYLRGARNVMVPKWDPEAFLSLVERERATGSFMVPTMMASLTEAAAGGRFDLRSLKTISYGGAPIAPARLQESMRILGNVFVQVYGSCEAPHPLTILTRDDHLAAKDDPIRLATIGRLTHQTEIRLVDAEGNPVAQGENGEMQVRGAHVMSGYWDDPEATAAALRDGWYATGDVARMDGEGYLSIVDRSRDMIISGGLNVYPAEVERILHEHPAIAEVAVVGVPDDRWGEAVKAVVVLRAGASASETDLVEHCRARLAGYKKPQSVDFVPELPKGSTGKILKREIRERYWQGVARRVH